jgi:hypothetical protein
VQHKENEKERKTGHGKKWIVGKREREREKERQKSEIKCRLVQKEN